MQIRVSQVSKVEPSRNAVEALVGPQEALLGRAVGFPDVTQESVREPRDLLLILAHEVLEQLGAPGPDLPDEPAFVRRGFGFVGNHREGRHEV